MPRKLVALREDQLAELERLAAQREDQHQGNVSAEIRDAVDKHIKRKAKAKGAR